MALSGAASASAATATVRDPVGDNGRSFDYEPIDATQVSASWDGASLVVGIVYSSPPASRSATFLIADRISYRDDTRCAGDSADSISIAASNGNARLTVPFVDGALRATATWSLDGLSATYEFTDPILVENYTGDDPIDPFTCLSGTADGDRFLGAFDGKILKITPAVAEDTLQALLQRRFGRAFSGDPNPWVKCPRQEIIPETDRYAPWAMCQFEFRQRKGVYQIGGVSLSLGYGTLEPEARITAHRITKKLKRCKPLAALPYREDQVIVDRRLMATDLVGCRDNGASMIRDVHYLPHGIRTVAFHGTKRGGFEDQVQFHCVLASHGSTYTARCANKLGDRFVYSWKVHRNARRSAAPPEAPPARECDANYSGCLNPNASDYDCAGGGGNGPLYTGEVKVLGDDHYGLDANHNGTACE